MYKYSVCLNAIFPSFASTFPTANHLIHEHASLRRL
jgi:hypothetical protein